MIAGRSRLVVSMKPEPLRLERIVFPIDLSEESRKAVPFVKAMVGRFHSELVVLHVIEIPAAYYMPSDAVGWELLTDTDEFRQLRKSAVETLLAEEFRGIPAVPEFAEGDPASEIVRYAHEHKDAFIMMPTHGYGTFRRFLLGSVTAKVLHDADCPVWTAVHMQERASSVCEAPRRILCAVDGGSDAVRVIRWATEFGRQVEAEVRFVHALPGSTGASPTDERYREQLFQLAQEELRRLREEAGVPFEVTIQEGEPGQAIRTAAEDLKTDLVIIGRGKIQKPFGRLRSHAYAIIRDAPCPVISV